MYSAFIFFFSASQAMAEVAVSINGQSYTFVLEKDIAALARAEATYLKTIEHQASW